MGPHAGDMENFTVRADGTAKVTITDSRVNLGTDNIRCSPMAVRRS